jgi:hypothetical protein
VGDNDEDEGTEELDRGRREKCRDAQKVRVAGTKGNLGCKPEEDLNKCEEDRDA